MKALIVETEEKIADKPKLPEEGSTLGTALGEKMAEWLKGDYGDKVSYRHGKEKE